MRFLTVPDTCFIERRFCRLMFISILTNNSMVPLTILSWFFIYFSRRTPSPVIFTCLTFFIDLQSFSHQFRRFILSRTVQSSLCMSLPTQIISNTSSFLNWAISTADLKSMNSLCFLSSFLARSRQYCTKSQFCTTQAPKKVFGWTSSSDLSIS